MKNSDTLKMKRGFPKTLEMWRIKRGLSIPKLAEKANVGVSSIRQYENGTNEPTLSALILLSKALNISVTTLVKDV